MEFHLNKTIEILERTPKVLDELLSGLPGDWVMNNEGADTWSPYDIVGHLIHGEHTDWMGRLDTILHKEDKRFVPYDRFAQFKESEGKDLQQLLSAFKQLRKDNLQKLKDLKLTDTDLDKTGIHPSFGEVTLRQLLSTWTIHDLTHIAQITRVMAKQYKEAIGPWLTYFLVLQ
ncbi:MAG TPA: DinB family protein [Chitinophagaceae bacterium]|nr:DinB family protein [Chitinophagaceae bacterium]